MYKFSDFPFASLSKSGSTFKGNDLLLPPSLLEHSAALSVISLWVRGAKLLPDLSDIQAGINLLWLSTCISYGTFKCFSIAIYT